MPTIASVQSISGTFKISGQEIAQPAVTALPNGSYVVASPYWQNDTVQFAGAVTWVNGAAPVAGRIGADNSLVGTGFNDSVGSGGVFALSNGNYVVSSPNWDNNAVSNVGAVTWVDGVTGLIGPISVVNSLLGVSAQDQIGSDGITPLPHGDYVIASPRWSSPDARNVGAVTWASGTAKVTGFVSAANSTTGALGSDYVGSGGVYVVGGGNYVIASPSWSLGAASDAGAVSWRDGLRADERGRQRSQQPGGWTSE